MTAEDHTGRALIVFGIGSGATVESILRSYGPQKRSQDSNDFADHETKPEKRIPVWVVDPDPAAVERARERFDWSEAIGIQRLRFFTGPDAVRQVEAAVGDSWTAQLTDAVVSQDTAWPKPEIDAAMARIDAAIARLVEERLRLAETWRKRQAAARGSESGTANIAALSERFSEGNTLKVLCISTRFATFVGHSMASLARGFERLGHQVELFREPSDAHRLKPETIQRVINDMEPDLIVSANYNRAYFERGACCFDGIPFCCWVQDPPTDDLRSEESRNEQTELDIYFACMQEWKDELQSLGFVTAEILKVPTDDEVYTPGEPTPEEREQYGCDVSCISTIYPEVIDYVESGPPKDSTGVEAMMYVDAFHQNRERLTQGEQQLLPEAYRAIIMHRAGWTTVPLEMEDEVRKLMLRLEARAGRLAFRSLPMIWLCEDGYGLKLYGGGWENHSTLSARHCGTIPYGKPLGSMLRASNMHLCTHGIWTLTMKVLDCLAAGTFPMVHWVDPERDTEPITEWYQEDRDIVLFRTREELLDKTRYYMDHPDERSRITRRGREVTLKHFTYVRAAEKILSDLRDRFRVSS